MYLGMKINDNNLRIIFYLIIMSELSESSVKKEIEKKW